MLFYKCISGFCILLRRLAYSNRLADMQLIFGRSKQDISHIFNATLNYIYYNFRHLIHSLQQWWLEPTNLEEYCKAIEDKGSVLPNCFGFIDGTLMLIIINVYFIYVFI